MAVDRSVDLLLIDERFRSRVARDLELTTVGTVGILAAAAGKGLVSLRASFDGQRATSFRGPDGLMDELLRKDESSPRPHSALVIQTPAGFAAACAPSASAKASAPAAHAAVCLEQTRS